MELIILLIMGFSNPENAEARQQVIRTCESFLDCEVNERCVPYYQGIKICVPRR